jgi:WhiB family transcriptional regulator, redox-sensing transcriptional regulator
MTAVSDTLQTENDDTAWMKDAVCQDYPTELFFPEVGGSLVAAGAICARCWVSQECLKYALSDPELSGVWGGTSARERGRMRARRVA